MLLSTAGLSYLKVREALRLKAYQVEKGGSWAIGYGCETYKNGVRVKSGDTITQAGAIDLLNYHVGLAVSAVNKLVTATLTQNQFDALVSFCYNVGSPRFSASQLLKVINEDPNNVDDIQIEMYRWIYTTVNGAKVQSPGLITRRREEMEMYRNGVVASNNGLIFIVILLIILYRYRGKFKFKIRK